MICGAYLFYFASSLRFVTCCNERIWSLSQLCISRDLAYSHPMSCSTTLSKKLLYSLGIAFGYRDIPHFLPFIPSRPKSSIPTFHRTETPKHHQNPYHHLPSQPWNPHCKIIRKRVERKVNKKQLHQVNFPPAPATIIVQSKLVFPFLSFDDAVSIVVSCSQNIPTPHLSLFSLSKTHPKWPSPIIAIAAKGKQKAG